MSDRERIPCETTALIALVRERPCLWDRSSRGYRRQKERAWEEVFRALHPSYGELSKAQQREFGILISRKWYNIRDCYKKYLNGSSRVNVSGRPYVYADQLTFLDSLYEPNDDDQNRDLPYESKNRTLSHETKDHDRKRELTDQTKERKLPCQLKDQDRKRKLSHETKHSPREPETEEQEGWISKVFVEMETTENEPLDAAKKIKTEYLQVENRDIDSQENIINVIANLIQKEEDEDRAFFNSITPTVKSLSDDDKHLFRIHVMKLLNALKRKERQLPPLEEDNLLQYTDSE